MLSVLSAIEVPAYYSLGKLNFVVGPPTTCEEGYHSDQVTAKKKRGGNSRVWVDCEYGHVRSMLLPFNKNY